MRLYFVGREFATTFPAPTGNLLEKIKMAMKKTLTVLDVEERTAKKSGNKYRVAQCIVQGEKIKVGELMIFNAEIKVEKGEYVADFDIGTNFDRQVVAELIALTPVPKAAGPRPSGV